MAVPQDVPKSAETFELQLAQQHYTVVLPKTPGTYALLCTARSPAVFGCLMQPDVL